MFPRDQLNLIVTLTNSELEEQEGGESSGDKGDGEQTMGRTIRYRGDGKQYTEELHQRLTVKVELFYAKGGVVASTDPVWLQSVFGFLTGMVDRLGFWTNIRKTVGVVFWPCQAARVRSD